MSKFSFSVYLNAYNDQAPSNNPGLNNFKWARDISSMIVNNPTSAQATVAPGETKSLFNGSRTLAQDNTTEYGIALKPLSSNTYVLSWDGGTAPNFRTPKSAGADATTQITTTVNGPIVTFTSTGGTALDMTGVSVGDQATIGNLFNVLNQGTFKIVALTSNSFSVENSDAVAEGPITLGSGFADQISIFGSTGVQVNDTLVISSGFSLVSQGSYKITAVYANSLEFYFTDALPQESSVMTQVAIYSNAKSFVYLEADASLNVIVNGQNVGNILPFIIPSAAGQSLPPTVVPGVFMLNSTIYSLSVQNNGTDPSNMFLAATE